MGNRGIPVQHGSTPTRHRPVPVTHCGRRRHASAVALPPEEGKAADYRGNEGSWSPSRPVRMRAIRSGGIRAGPAWTTGGRHCKLLGMRIMNHEPTPADARVLVVGTGRMELPTTRQEPAAGAGEVLSGYSPRLPVAAPSGAPVAVAGEVFARSRLSRRPLRAAVGRLRDGGGPAAPPSGSGSGGRVRPGNRRPVGGELLGRSA